jgi:hypothetical protein
MYTGKWSAGKLKMIKQENGKWSAGKLKMITTLINLSSIHKKSVKRCNVCMNIKARGQINRSTLIKLWGRNKLLQNMGIALPTQIIINYCDNA